MKSVINDTYHISRIFL